jgi:hypothetical protein
MPPAPSTQPSIRYVFSSTYRGGTKQWSTRIHFTPSVNPTSATFDAILAGDKPYIKPALPTWTTLVEAVGYYAGSEVPVWTSSVNEACTFPDGSSVWPPLATAAFFRFGTTQRTSKNHPIYLGQYIHAVGRLPASSDHELADTNQTENIRQWLIRWVNGISIGGSTYKKTGPYGAVAQSLHVPIYLTHRDFPT